MLKYLTISYEFCFIILIENKHKCEKYTILFSKIECIVQCTYTC